MFLGNLPNLMPYLKQLQTCIDKPKTCWPNEKTFEGHEHIHTHYTELQSKNWTTKIPI